MRVPATLCEEIGSEASDELMIMFAEAHRLATESFEQRLALEISALRLDITEQLATMRFDLLKWSFLFWIGQFAGIIAVLSFILDR